MADHEVKLRSLAVQDERFTLSILGPAADEALLDAKTLALVRLAALIALDANPVSYQAVVEKALAAGATPDEVVDVLISLAPTIGLPRVVSKASPLALALGYDIDEALEELSD